MDEQWHHCRACGEESLTPDVTRCPHCGVDSPVIVCDRCGRPIRQEAPWTIQARSLARDDTPVERVYQYHADCYPLARRALLLASKSRAVQWVKDPRDTSEPITPLRWAIGLACLGVGGACGGYLLKSMPPPQPVLPVDVTLLPPAPVTGAATRAEADWARLFPKPPSKVTLLGLIVPALGILAGLALIRWGLFRRRATMLERLLKGDDCV